MNHPYGRFCHLTGFMRAVAETYGYEPSYWLFKERDEVVGIFPLFLHKSFLRTCFLSQPASEYGGPLIGRDTPIDLMVLQEHLSKLLDNTGARFIEIHGGMGIAGTLGCALFQEKPLHHCGILQLTDTHDLWGKLHPSGRKAIRKAQGAGLECYEETNEFTLKKKFYPLYVQAMKRFGTPPHPCRFYLNLYKHLASNMRLFLVEHNGTTVACLLGFTTGQAVHIVWNVSRHDYLFMRPNDLAHWTFIAWSSNRGFKRFDFGPIRYAGQQQFKEKWGMESRVYSFYYFPPEIPVKPSYTASGLMSGLWRRMPLKLAERLGVHVRRAYGR